MVFVHSVATTNHSGFAILDQAQSSMTTRCPSTNSLNRISFCS